MRYRVYSCCTDDCSDEFTKPAQPESVHDDLVEALDQIKALGLKGKDAWYEQEEDDD